MIFSSKLTRLITLLCIFLSGCGSQESPESLLRKGKERAAAGDQNEAIRILRLIPKEAKEWPEARLQLGRFSALRQNEAEAIEYLNEVPQDGSKSALAAATYLAEIHMNSCFRILRKTTMFDLFSQHCWSLPVSAMMQLSC
jgi:thioredoxin-like negative regulator of GroEL